MVNLIAENISYIINFTGTLIQRECTTITGARLQTLECINKFFCPQISTHIVKVGVILLIFSFVLLILSNLYFKYWYKKFNFDFGNNYNNPINKFIGDLNDEKVRLTWKVLIRELINDLMFFYILLVVYLNI